MLVLSRKVGEKIIIRDTETGEAISVMLVEIHGHRNFLSHVRLGIDAGPRFRISREELDSGSTESADPSNKTP
ncbi:MAG: carbon storage regulator [Phycisphaerales bacterium]|nr:MAG: carbon storage regulator [Phycisphaerales bacterium]